MNNDANANPAAEVVFGATVVTAGLGVLTFALFPLALPIVVLTGVLFAPLLPLVLAGVLLTGVVVALRATWRHMTRVGPRPAARRRRGRRRSAPDLRASARAGGRFLT